MVTKSNKKTQTGEADSKCFWRSEKKKSLWANGVRKDEAEPPGMGRIYMGLEKRGGISGIGLTQNGVSSCKTLYLHAAYANCFWRHSASMDVHIQTNIRHSQMCLSVYIHYKGLSHKQFYTP